MQEDPVGAECTIRSIERQLGNLLEVIRSLATEIYPAVLRSHGLRPALQAAARRSPLVTSVDAPALDRYHRDTEVAVYFCCLEALQNCVKHAGSQTDVKIRLREESDHLLFEITDAGTGFDPGHVVVPHGLLHMRDRTETVGGTLEIDSSPGCGTSVRGRVPISRP